MSLRSRDDIKQRSVPFDAAVDVTDAANTPSAPTLLADAEAV
jgi:hypothetical protein